MKKIISIVLCLVLCLGFCATAFADVNVEDLSKYFLSETLTVEDDIDITGLSFKFKFEGQNYADGDTTAAECVDGGTYDITVPSQASNRSGGEATGIRALSTIFDNASQYPHAGEYAYKVTQLEQTITSAGGVTKTLTKNPDDTVYFVRLMVANKDGGLVFAGLIVTKSTMAGDKVDPGKTTTTTDNHEVSGFNFSNTYTEVLENADGVLTATKKITGDYGNLSKKFSVTVKVTVPDTADTDNDVAVTGGTISWSGKVGTVTADLGNNESIKFTKLPAGTTYVVSEKADKDYGYKFFGDVVSPDTDAGEYHTVTATGDEVSKNGSAAITTVGKTVTIDNHRDKVPETGIIVNNLPFVLIVLLAVSGIAVYFVINRRREQED